MSEKHAGIYARRSNEQKVPDEAKSVERQRANALAFAAKKGWVVADGHIFIDDGISGAEFEKRPGFQAMLAAARRGGFAVLIVAEQKALGREMLETGGVIKQLALAGVEVWGYMDGRSLTPRNHTEKLMTMVQGFSDEDHRVKTAQRMHEALMRLVRAGHVAGGRVYGYRNRKVYVGTDRDGNPLLSHVERVVHDGEAVIVVRIFEMYASGLGFKAIAKRLTAEGVPGPLYAPHSNQVLLEGWSPSSVGDMLRRELYRGQIVWNQWRKRDDWGRSVASRRSKEEHLRIPAEHLRIVDEALWLRVQSRLADVAGRAVRFESGRLSGRPARGEVRNLLSGLSTCGVCGSGLVVEACGRPRGDAFGLDSLPTPGSHTEVRRRYRYYACALRRRNSACENTLRVPAELLEEAVLQAVEEHALTPEAVDQVVLLSEQNDLADRRDALVAEAADVDTKLSRLVALAEAGGDVAPLAARIRELQEKRQALADELAGLRPVPRLPRRVVESRLEEWRRLLRASTTQGRAVLQRIIRGRITFTPDGDGYTFEAQTRFDKLFSGFAAPLSPWVKLGTAEEAGLGSIGPEDTMDPEYGRLLDRAAHAAERARKGAKRASGSTPTAPAGGTKSARKGRNPSRGSHPSAHPLVLYGSVRVA